MCLLKYSNVLCAHWLQHVYNVWHEAVNVTLSQDDDNLNMIYTRQALISARTMVICATLLVRDNICILMNGNITILTNILVCGKHNTNSLLKVALIKISNIVWPKYLAIKFPCNMSIKLNYILHIYRILHELLFDINFY